MQAHRDNGFHLAAEAATGVSISEALAGQTPPQVFRWLNDLYPKSFHCKRVRVNTKREGGKRKGGTKMEESCGYKYVRRGACTACVWANSLHKRHSGWDCEPDGRSHATPCGYAWRRLLHMQSRCMCVHGSVKSSRTGTRTWHRIHLRCSYRTPSTRTASFKPTQWASPSWHPPCACSPPCMHRRASWVIRARAT